jgi:leader peptidase (prepilin peptidase) / N-methyltransferase
MSSMVADIEFLEFFVPLCLLGGVLALIDTRQGIIPDWMNLTIAGLGLSKALAVGGSLAGLEAACEGIAVGALFWGLRRLYFVLRKIQGLGLGDVKFLAAAGLWIGIAGLPMLLLVAALAALAAAGCMQLAGQNMTGRTSISFGPFLTLGLLITLAVQQYQP